MFRVRRRQALFCAGLLLFLTFFAFCAVTVISVPSELHLLPGEVGRLQVGFPLSLWAPEESRAFLADSLAEGSELVFRSVSTGDFEVELSLLGAIPLRKVAVKIVPERMVVPGGHAIGVLLAAEGVVVVGHRALRGLDGRQRYPAKEAGIEVGDIILRVDGIAVRRAEDLASLVGAAYLERRPVRVMLRRSGHLIARQMEPVLCDTAPNREQPRAMLGLYVEDPAAGVGTLTFYDPRTGGFAALGHRISELGGQRRVWLEGGKIVAARISGIEQGQRGSPGEKIGTFSGPEDIIGNIDLNSRFGLFGKLACSLPGENAVPVALAHQVHIGPATIRTVIQGDDIQEFKVEIVRVYRQQQPHDKGLVIKVTDPDLLSLTGGIVQGMSGSPIIQDGRLVGAVTHVFVNDPTRGYGVIAEWMVHEMDTVTASQAA